LPFASGIRKIYFLASFRVQHRSMAFRTGRTDFMMWSRAVIRSPLFLALLGLWLLLLTVEWICPCFFLHDDNASWFLGAYVHDFQVLTETGRWAEVNYNQYGGEPFLEQGQTAVLYPPVYVGVALGRWVSGDYRWAIEWMAAGHLTLGLVGFHYWLRQSGVAARFAALGALAWVLNPFVLMVGSSWIMTTYVVAWLPWSFWALDRLLARPSASAALVFGMITGFFFLQGYVQWFAYSLLAEGLYGLFYFVLQPGMDRRAVLYYLSISALVFATLAAPLLLPMVHAVGASAARAEAISIELALEFRVLKVDLIHAQFCLFRPGFIFGMSTAILYCPALLLLPMVVLRFCQGTLEFRRRVFPLLLLTVLGLFFSSRWHVLLSLLPVLDRFRWPFKVFLPAEFFMLASLVFSVSSWIDERGPARRFPNVAAMLCLTVVLLAGVVISLGFHDGNFFSKVLLPTSNNPLPRGMDPQVGRVIAVSDRLPELQGYRYFTHGYSTYFGVPNLGGYDPLVGRDQLRYALGLDFPDVFTAPLTPAVRQQLEARAVRYWLVDPHSPRLVEVENLPGLKRLDADADRVVLEDMRAEPLIASTSNPTLPIAMTYSGNSILVPLSGVTSPLAVSLGPADGWWYRIDRGPWTRPVDRNDHLIIPVEPTSRTLEITYFDARFRQGLGLSGLLLVLLAILLERSTKGRSRGC
jgi:hypothetical protein